MLSDGFFVCSKFFCTLRYIVCQRVYIIDDAIIYSKRPLLRLRPLPSNNELSAEKAHWDELSQGAVCCLCVCRWETQAAMKGTFRRWVVSFQRQTTTPWQLSKGSSTMRHISGNIVPITSAVRIIEKRTRAGYKFQGAPRSWHIMHWTCILQRSNTWVTLTLSSRVVSNGYTSNCSPHTGLTHRFKFFDIRALWRSVLSARVPECQKIKRGGLYQ